MVKLINKLKRSALAEGRNYRLGFAFATKKDNIVEVVGHGITACKDFLNDICYSQHTGKPYSIYGCHATDIGLFKNVPAAYIVISVLKKGAKSPKVYEDYLSDIKNLEAKHPNIEKLLHYFEEKFKVDGRTKVEKIRKNHYLVTAPLFWTQYTYLISLYTLLIRMAMFWDGKGEVMSYLEKFKEDSEDMMYLKSIKGKLSIMLSGNIPVQDLAKCKNPHNQGIVSFQFPIIKPKVEKMKIAPAKIKIPESPKAEKPIDNSSEFDKVWELS